MDPTTLSTIATVVIGIVTGVMVPAIKRLFDKFGDLDEKLEAEREARRELQLVVARDYVSRVALKEAMEPFQKNDEYLIRMVERIASKLHIPAVGDDY